MAIAIDDLKARDCRLGGKDRRGKVNVMLFFPSLSTTTQEIAANAKKITSSFLLKKYSLGVRLAAISANDWVDVKPSECASSGKGGEFLLRVAWGRFCC